MIWSGLPILHVCFYQTCVKEALLKQKNVTLQTNLYDISSIWKSICKLLKLMKTTNYIFSVCCFKYFWNESWQGHAVICHREVCNKERSSITRVELVGCSPTAFNRLHIAQVLTARNFQVKMLLKPRRICLFWIWYNLSFHRRKIPLPS